jgi:hypothetical protein
MSRLQIDETPFIWNGTYTDILKNGGNKFEEINKLRDLLSGKFRLMLKLTDIFGNLYVNGKPCLVRKNKHKPITVYPNVKILEGTDSGWGGSNKHPRICFKEGYCVVEVKTDGFPHMELDTYEMKIEILEFERIG